jgi:hypothetical protein
VLKSARNHKQFFQIRENVFCIVRHFLHDRPKKLDAEEWVSVKAD